MSCSEIENVVDETLSEVSDFAYDQIFSNTVVGLRKMPKPPSKDVTIRKVLNGIVRVINKVMGTDLIVVRRVLLDKLDKLETLMRHRAYMMAHWPPYLIAVSKFHKMLVSLRDEPEVWINACESFADKTSKRAFVDLVRLSISFPVYCFSPQLSLKTIKGVNPVGINVEKYGIKRIGVGDYFPLYSIKNMFKIEVTEELIKEIFIYKGYQYDDVGVKPRSSSVYLDLGAYAGETVAWYAMEAEDVRAIAVEPGEVVKVMERNLKEDRMGKFLNERRVRVKIVKKIITEDVRPEELDIIPKRESHVFIKSDIEGAERSALRALRGYLHEYRPTMVLAAYHLWDDLIVLPKLILEANPDYKLYLRPDHFRSNFNIFAK